MEERRGDGVTGEGLSFVFAGGEEKRYKARQRKIENFNESAKKKGEGCVKETRTHRSGMVVMRGGLG